MSRESKNWSAEERLEAAGLTKDQAAYAAAIMRQTTGGEEFKGKPFTDMRKRITANDGTPIDNPNYGLQVQAVPTAQEYKEKTDQEEARMADKEKFLKGKINEHLELLAVIETVASSINQQGLQKQELKQHYKKILAELPLHKINDDIFDVDSEVLKSEKHHIEFVIKYIEDDIVFLNRMMSTIKKSLYKQAGIQQTSSDDTSEDVKKARREKIKNAHPDRGGSSEELKRVLAEFDVGNE